VVGIVTTLAAIMVYRRASAWPQLRALALAAPLLVIAQIVLGVFTVLTMRSVPVAVGHFAGAVALWAVWTAALLLTIRRQPSVKGATLVEVP
jgi:heme A synthase